MCEVAVCVEGWMCAYRLFGCCHICPGLDVPGKRKYFATTTPVHGPRIKVDFCRLSFSKERDVHRPAGRRRGGDGRTEGRV